MAKEEVKFEVGLKRSRIFDSWRGKRRDCWRISMNLDQSLDSEEG